ncbi:outer membrane protein transport protein [Roseibium sp. HPY-6]|uniref:OmpP1/FadL family transporter n=1 Tax=Roseibium sp. HPY-6 TaxID=3229852 RepID=UPI0033901E30
MMWANKKTFLFASTALALSMVAGAAHAGGFALREQSAYYQGTSFAGNGTSGETISSMFWNPATITAAGKGLTFESHSSFIAPQSDLNGVFTPQGTVNTLTGGFGRSTAPSGDIASNAWIPSTYTSYGLTDKWYFGLAINTPYGLATKPEQSWAGQYYSRSSEVFSVNVNPTVAYKVNDMVSVAAGLQVEYLQIRLKSAYPLAASLTSSVPSTEVKGGSLGFGATAGITIKPMEGTEIGVGFRSAVFHSLDGHFINPASVPAVGVSSSRTGIEANVILPEMVTISAKQRITDKFRVLGTVEWTNWSRLGTVHLSSTDGTTTNPTGLPDLAFNYEDGWFFAVGGEYDFNDQVTLRAGVAYELSPIDEDIRSTRLPDNDRLWLSAGATWKPSEHLAFDVGYSHLIPADTQINIGPGHQDYNANIGTYTADVESQVNIISASLRYKF